jgi:hypothetical protein
MNGGQDGSTGFLSVTSAGVPAIGQINSASYNSTYFA